MRASLARLDYRRLTTPVVAHGLVCPGVHAAGKAQGAWRRHGRACAVHAISGRPRATGTVGWSPGPVLIHYWQPLGILRFFSIIVFCISPRFLCYGFLRRRRVMIYIFGLSDYSNTAVQPPVPRFSVRSCKIRSMAQCVISPREGERSRSRSRETRPTAGLSAMRDRRSRKLTTGSLSVMPFCVDPSSSLTSSRRRAPSPLPSVARQRNAALGRARSTACPA